MSVRPSIKSLAVLIGFALACLFTEVATRVYFASNVGPRVLLYGTDWFRNIDYRERGKKLGLTEAAKQEVASEWGRKDSVEHHAQKLGDYSKFFPNEIKTTGDADTGERIPVTINSRGFRGKDFEKTKAPGVIRVLTLGSSSTFGYYNRDEETYPYLLERLLNEACGRDFRFEVINFAIPHAGSTNIAAMFAAEGVPLAPDVITFYEGRNDSILNRKYDGVFAKLYSVLVHRLLLVAFLDQILVGERASVTDASLKVEPQAEELGRVFLKNLTTILDTARNAGAKLIVANQQATAKSPVPGAKLERLSLRGVTYNQEAEDIRRRTERNGELTAYEYSFLVHQQLMKNLEQWAKRHHVPFVDIIGALDQDRHYMLSWVHLHPEANRVVAAKFSEAILREVCAAGIARRSEGEARRPPR